MRAVKEMPIPEEGMEYQQRKMTRSPKEDQVEKTSRIRLCAYHAYTIWLFTCSYITQFIIPETIFEICGALSGSAITTNQTPHLLVILGHWPKALLWIWANTLINDLSNQRQLNSIEEDSINKKWRPIPAGRLTPQQARRLQLYAVPIIFCFSSFLGAAQETPIMYLVLWMYNDLGGFYEHFLNRNIIIAIGYVWCSFGIIKVVSDGHGLSHVGYIWFRILCILIATTMDIQKLRDQEGDRLVRRKTTPLVLGDTVARWSIVVALIGWSTTTHPFMYYLLPHDMPAMTILDDHVDFSPHRSKIRLGVNSL